MNIRKSLSLDLSVGSLNNILLFIGLKIFILEYGRK